jgi:hypothetical protein
MTYSISGLDPSPFDHLTGLSGAELARYGAVRMVAEHYPDFPCRVTLDDVAPGQAVILVNHVSHDGGPFHASHAIFVSEGKSEAAHYVDAVPPALDRRLLSVRAFDAAGMMVDATLAQPGEGDAAFRRLLASSAIDHLDAHYATRGCFAARVERN